MIVKKLKANIECMDAKAAAAFVEKSTRFKSEVMILKGSRKANGKSLIGVISLVLKAGEEFIIRIEGEDELKAEKELLPLL